MYSRRSNGLPGCWVVIAAALFVFGGYYLWRGFMVYMESNGDIVAPILTGTASNGIVFQTATAQSILGTFDLQNLTPVALTPTKSCMEFKVKVVKARIRECPKDTCNTLDLPNQGASICVYGVAADDNDWYEINVDPKDPITQLGYMHKSVLYPVNPTKTPLPTLKLPTVTLIPTLAPSHTFTPSPTPTPNPAAPPTWTLTPTPTPVPLDDTA